MSIGYTAIECLTFLRGLPYDELAKAYIHALRPSSVRVSTGFLTSDAKAWRVTVMTDERGIIGSISQEVDVDLGEFAHGHALDSELRRRRELIGVGDVIVHVVESHDGIEHQGIVGVFGDQETAKAKAEAVEAADGFLDCTVKAWPVQ